MRELGSGDILYILGAIRWTLLLSLVVSALSVFILLASQRLLGGRAPSA